MPTPTARFQITAADNTKRAFASVNKNIDSLKNSFLRIGAGVGLSVAIQKTLGEFSDYEKGLTAVGKTANIEGKQLEALGEQIQDIGGVVPVSRDGLFEIAAAAAQVGVSGSSDILAFTETLARLELATDVVGESGAKSIARILKVSGDALDTVDEFGSVLTRLGNNAAASESEILEMATRIAQSTALYEVSSTEALALGAAFKSVGEQAEATGTVLGQTFAALSQASAEGGENLKLISQVAGVTQAEFRKLFGESSAKAFEQFVQGLGNLEGGAEDVRKVLEQLGLSGVRPIRVLGALSNASGELTNALALMEDELQGGTALFDESVKSANTFSGQMQLLSNAADKAGVGIGALIAPAALTGIKVASAAAETLSNNIDAVGDAAIVVSSVFAGRLVNGLIESTRQLLADAAATSADAFAKLELAKATATQAHAAHAGAVANLRMANAMEFGAAKAKAQYAAMLGVAAATKANTAAITGVATATAAATARIGLLGRAIGLLGGVPGLIITGLATGYLLLRDNTEEATAAQREYDRVMRRTSNAIDKATASVRELAIAEAEEAIATKQATQALIQKEAAALSARSAASGPLSPASQFEVQRLEDLGRGYGKLQREIESLVTKVSGGRKTIKGAGDSADEFAAKLDLVGGKAKSAGKDVSEMGLALDAISSQFDALDTSSAAQFAGIGDINFDAQVRFNVIADMEDPSRELLREIDDIQSLIDQSIDPDSDIIFSEDQIDVLHGRILTINGEIDALNDEVDTGLTEAEKRSSEFADALAANMTSAFEDAILETKNASDILNGILEDILRTVIRFAGIQPLTSAIGSAISPYVPNFGGTAIPKNAQGTDYHPGGLAVVGDGGEAEVVQLPTGDYRIVGQHEEVINIPRGSTITPISDIPRYASGTNKMPTDFLPAISPASENNNVNVYTEIINNVPGVEVSQETTTRPDGSILLRYVLDAVARDVVTNGVVGRAFDQTRGTRQHAARR